MNSVRNLYGSCKFRKSVKITENIYHFANLESGKLYSVYVFKVLTRYSISFVRKFSFYASKKGPKAVKDFEITSIDYYEALARWNETEVTEMHSKRVFYKLILTADKLSITMYTKLKNYLLINLNESTAYCLTVIGFDSNDVPGEFNKKCFNTKCTTMYTLKNIHIDIQYDKFNVTWMINDSKNKKVKVHKDVKHKVHSYQVKITAQNNLIEYFQTNKTFFIYSNPIECLTYCASLKILTNDNYICSKSIELCETIPYKNELANLTFHHIESGSFTKKKLEWSFMPKFCFIESEVFIWVKNYRNKSYCSKSYRTKLTYHEVTLKKDMEYETYVESVLINNNKIKSEIQSFYTGNIMHKLQLEFFKTEFIAKNFIKMKWSLIASDNDQIKAIDIKLYENNRSDCEKRLLILPKTTKNCTIEYEIENNTCKGAIDQIHRSYLLQNELKTHWTNYSVYAEMLVITNNNLYIEWNSDTVLSDNHLKNCFADCFGNGKYDGIRSVDENGSRCDSGLCKVVGDQPKCYVNATLSNCEIPKCDNVPNGDCVKLDLNRLSNHVLKATWKKEDTYIGYFVLLYNKMDVCLEYTEFIDKPIKYGISVRNFYKSCAKFRIKSTSKIMEYKFTVLKNYKYKIYLIPITDFNSFGFVTLLKYSFKSDTTESPIGLIIGILFCLLVIVGIIFVIFKYKKRRALPFLQKLSFHKELNIYSIEVKKLSKHIQASSKNSYASLMVEYKKLNTVSKTLVNIQRLTTTIGSLEENQKKNSSEIVVAYDQTRVQLSNQFPPNDYINANKIPSKDDFEKTEYVACQGPTEETVTDFIQMIWDQKISTIIMLIRIEENETFKYVSYYPNEVTEYITFENNMEMYVDNQHFNKGFIVRNLVLVNQSSNESQNITHVQMEIWSEYILPPLEHFDKMLSRIQKAPKHDMSIPYLVHCSDGIGRTGSFIAIDRITKEIAKGFLEVSVFDTILDLRKYRANMVNKEEQYVFIYRYLELFMRNKNLF